MDINQHVNSILDNMIISKHPQTELTTVEYINKIFPNEQSLSNIDEVLRILKEKINILDREIRSAICSQKTVEENGQKTLEDARNLIANLSNVINEIKNQAKQSEKIVNEITCNIKQLDNAKRNLTLSIIMLNNLHILVQGTFVLKKATQKRQYGTASKTLQGILDVLKQFDKFKHISHISKLTSDIDETCNILGEQILNDFREAFDSTSVKKTLTQNQSQVQLLAEGCLVLSILEPKYRRQLITWLVELELAEYKALFQDNQDIAWLDKIDSRFAWLKKHLITFEDKIGFLFPPNWEISECIAVEFCKITRQDLIKVMNNRFIELDVGILLPAISKATAFEKLLSQRFSGTTLLKDRSSNGGSQKNLFSGLITVCFENYLNIYVEAQDKNFEKLINQFIEEKTKASNQDLNKAEVFPTSGKLFTQYKNCLIQCISLSNRMPLVLLANTFQKYLREYAHKILQSTIPRIGSNISLASLSSTIASSSSGGVLSAASSAAGLIQIFLKDLENKSYTIAELVQICSIILTSNYCLETTQQLEKKIQEKIDPSLVDKINMSSECDIFHGIISNCIQLLSHSIEYSCEQPLNAMIKTTWSNMETPVGHSQYVSSLISTFHQSFPVIRENLSDLPKYYHNFCGKFVEAFISKYISNIFKCKPLSQGAAEQLLLDSNTLKKVLLDLPDYKSNNKNQQTPQPYLNKVVSGMSKAEMILKIVLVRNDSAEMFVENYFKLFPEKDLMEFQKIIEMKGIKKSESITMTEIFKKKLIHQSFDNFHINDDENPEPSSSANIDSNRIKKLEKLIKKRL